MKLNIQSQGHDRHRKIFEKAVSDRLVMDATAVEMKISLDIDESIGTAESYLIQSEHGGWKITGADDLGLYYGIGKFLHSARWTEDDFAPQPPTGVCTPAQPFRAFYASVHFHNWYHEASIEEVRTYLEELLLWGYNTVISIIPLVNLHHFDEPDFLESVKKVRELFQVAKGYEMKVGIVMVANQGLLTTPDDIEADLSLFEYRGGNSGKNVCPEKEGAMVYLKHVWGSQLEAFRDIGLDYVISWPYDEGGCGCEQCKPWGSRGFCELSKKLYQEAKRLYPETKFILSTWYFDHPIEEKEYEGLWQRLKDDMDFVDYLMVDGHGDFPRYPLEHKINKPMLNFPEISMWGVMPWGGRGANPLPKCFQKIWDSSKQLLSGGMPYSEGIYEDISKVQCVSYYWSPDRKYQDSLAEYINYEYSGDVIDEVLELMELIEKNHVDIHRNIQPDMKACNRAEQIARSVNDRLGERAKKAWRWRILYIRAIIDKAVYQYHMDHDHGRTVKGMENEKVIKRYGQKVVLKGDEVALHILRQTKEWYLEDSEEAMQLAEELALLYHTDREQTHQCTYPPVQGREKALEGKVFGTV